MIGDPLACRFDPAALACPRGQDGRSCLTPAEVGVARRLYRGPVDASGDRLYPGGEPPGSELAWAGWVLPRPGEAPGRTIAALLGSAWLRYEAFARPSAAAAPLPRVFDRAALAGLEPLARSYDATSPDLAGFRARGGRLVLWHGAADQAIPPAGTVAYYRAVVAAAGGLASARGFARLFLVRHVPLRRRHRGGPDRPADRDDRLGRARPGPESTVAWQTDAGGRVVRTRPVFAWPASARWSGRGDPDDARSWIAR